jgi:hypothetical protein
MRRKMEKTRLAHYKKMVENNNNELFTEKDNNKNRVDTGYRNLITFSRPNQ